MTIFLNNIKRILRKKINLLFLIIVPVVLISFVSASTNQSFMTRVGVVDYDDTAFSRNIVESLSQQSRIQMIEEQDIQKKIFGQQMELAIIIEEGYTQDILSGNDVKVKTVSLEESDMSRALLFKLESDLNAAVNIARASDNDIDKFYEGMAAYYTGAFSVQQRSVDREVTDNGGRIGQMGFLVMSMLFLAGLSSHIMLEDKEKKVYYRVMAGPIRVSSFMIQNILSFVTVCIIQIILIFMFMTVFLNIDFGPNLLGMIIISIIFSFMCVALGVMVNTVSKNMRQAGVAMSMILPPMCMLGGCWWPREFMPEILQKIGQFVPTTWIMEAYTKLIYGMNLWDVINEILVLIAFTIIFILLATWRKVDIAK